MEMMFLTASTQCAHNAARETCQSFLSRRKNPSVVIALLRCALRVEIDASI